MKEKIMEILKKACALEEEITGESELKTLSLDSLSFVGAIVEMEDEFGISFDIDELDVFDFTTVSDIINSVEEKTNGKK